MAFDTSTRNRLAKFVGEARRLLTDEFIEQLQGLYGISATGSITPIERLGHLDAEGRELAGTLRQRIAYLVSSHADSRDATESAIARLTREQAFTIVNRLAAIRMAETRGLIVESVGQQYQSKGFKVFESVAGSAIGETFDRYRCYLFCLFDELAIDLGVLFDRKSPQAMLFPREPALLALLDLLDAPDLQPLWAEDETIGWIYQYYNDEAERKKMRDESAAPRNSRELAVRNQFFTPRYVVEFLTDSTLGRIWYEMTQGQTSLKDSCRYLFRRPSEIFLKAGEAAPENAASSDTEPGADLSQEELLKRPVYIPYRWLKDPRAIRLLDPACGSMHFGLYAFDLFTVIYDEAWEIAHSPDAAVKSAQFFAPFVAFAANFADKPAFLCDVPRLIIEHNLHGIDIDPRAAQIAGLSLWLRAQRAWHQANVKPADRPRITRSNIVCAEPMPGDKELLRDFVEQQFPAGEQPAFRFLLEKIFDRMTLAGEAGSLLRIEEEIRAMIADAKRIWEQEPYSEQKRLFADVGKNPEAVQKRLDLSGITTEEFWERAEERIYDALAAYAEQAEVGDGLKRRLFADDAADGFAFIDLCRKSYDAVVMNPPFGKATGRGDKYLRKTYESVWTDIYGCFLWRFGHAGSYVGCISSSLFLYTKQMRDLRQMWISTKSLHMLCELGPGVLDGATVETALTVSYDIPAGVTTFLDATSTADRAEALLGLVRNDISEGRKDIPLDAFTGIYLHPFCYHIDPVFIDLWSGPYRVEPDYATVAVGNNTFNDFRFQRLRWEVPYASIGTRWFGYEGGGEYQPFVSPTVTLYNWANDGKECRAYQILKSGTDAQVKQSISLWWKPGLTYPRVSSVAFGPRALPQGHIFSGDSISVFPHSNSDTLALLAFLCSTWAQDLIYAFGRYRKIEKRAVANLPLDAAQFSAVKPELEQLAKRGFAAVAYLESRRETSPFFVAPNFACLPASTGDSAMRHSVGVALREVTQETDRVVADLLFPKGGQPPHQAELRSDLVDRYAKENSEPRSTAVDLVSYCLGVGYGRWDMRFASNARSQPSPPQPLAALPTCPPGMLQAADGSPFDREDGRKSCQEEQYPIDISWDGILVDDQSHPWDVERVVSACMKELFKERGEEVEQEACSRLKVASVREWLRRPTGFFGEHLSRYSHSPRQAPIYWPLSTRSGDYTLWIYYHRLNDQTLHKCLADFLDPKITKVEKEIASLSGKSADKAADRRDFVNELKDLRDEIERVIKLPWRPNLNDGVLITACPLWKLFRLPKWSKDLKACWEELEKGDYDWAHLAYAIWPARVERACESDRSIAIAHGLEHLCKVEPPKPKKPRGKKASS
jgi:hypothetical protein